VECTDILSMLFLLYRFSVSLPFHSNNLSPVEGLCLPCTMHEFDKAVTIVITFLPPQHQSTTFHHVCRQHSCTGRCHFMQYEWVLNTTLRHLSLHSLNVFYKSLGISVCLT
jgi:hypothetical protein